jgi:hypothetical protein
VQVCDHIDRYRISECGAEQDERAEFASEDLLVLPHTVHGIAVNGVRDLMTESPR